MAGNHTPGPWRFFMGDICADGSDGDDRVIAGIGKSCGARSSVYSTIKAHRPEGIANANLIAAAPDLLEALRLAHDYFIDNGWEGDPRMESIISAITKAENN